MVGPQTKCRLPLQSVSDGSHLTTNVCGWAHRGRTCGFLCSGFRSPLNSLVSFITVALIIQVFHCDVSQVRQRTLQTKPSRTHAYITLTPLKPHFCIVKLGFAGIYIIFLISAQKHRLWVLVRTALARRFYRVPTIYVLNRSMKKNIRIFIWKLSVFGAEIFSIFE